MTRSEQLFQRAQTTIPGGVNSPVRAFRAVGGTPRFMVRGEGPWLFYADGRRYVDLVNQRQLLAVVRGEAPPYAPGSEALLGVLRDFEAAYDAYNEFQRNMERYWCLRWLIQENAKQAEAVVQRENLVRLARIPLYARIHSLPELAPSTRVLLEIDKIDLLDMEFKARYIATEEAPA